ncbi:MAG: beta-N-acetylglucosaminidase domain-containing protein [Opitutae bacterium]|nr:beta-N-acetylglucosaminidase domain-containing protein [Opitutae bacterium]
MSASFCKTLWCAIGLVSLGGLQAAETPSPASNYSRAEFRVVLPAAPRPFPEPLPAGAAPGFKWRGTKGWAWTPEQYLAEIPHLARLKMNFLMNCYLSLFDLEQHPDWNQDPDSNRWWEPLPDAKRLAFEQIVRECQSRGIEFCFGMNPNLKSRRIVNDGKSDSLDLLWQHYAWMQDLGVKWFNLSLDDIAHGCDASTQARVANELFRRLRAHDPAAQFIFCPTFYSGPGLGQPPSPLEERTYLETLKRELHPEIFVFWTGDAVVGKITRRAAESYRAAVGHRLFLWDNYPVNDGYAALHLGPVVGRDPDLNAVVEGYMSNPHRQQNEINRLPLATCADYAYNPQAYDPVRSIGQAIWLFTASAEQRQILADLVDAYPGFLICGSDKTEFNALLKRHKQIAQMPQSRLVMEGYLARLERLSADLKRIFPTCYTATKARLDEDIGILKNTPLK